MKDWTGGNSGLYSTNHRSKESEVEDLDFYATHPESVELFLKAAKDTNLQLPKFFLEPACGDGAICKVLVKHNHQGNFFDIAERGYGDKLDFFEYNKIVDEKYPVMIITNPPYKYAKEFVEKSLSLLKNKDLCIMFMKLTFLESKGRFDLFKNNPPKYVYIHVNRQGCGKGGGEFKNGGAACYAWYVWEKGCTDEPIIRWIN